MNSIQGELTRTFMECLLMETDRQAGSYTPYWWEVYSPELPNKHDVRLWISSSGVQFEEECPPYVHSHAWDCCYLHSDCCPCGSLGFFCYLVCGCQWPLFDHFFNCCPQVTQVSLVVLWFLWPTKASVFFWECRGPFSLWALELQPNHLASCMHSCTKSGNYCSP